MAVNRWEDAAFEQEHLLRHLDDYFGRLCDGYQTSAFGLPDDENTPHILTGIHREMLQRAEPVYVSGDSMTMWEYAREHSTYEVQPIVRTDLVVPCGFLLLPWPTSIIDASGREVKYRAVSWMPVSPNNTYAWDEGVAGQGVWVSMYSHIDDQDQVWDDATDASEAGRGDDMLAYARAAGWRWSLLHATPLMFGDRVWERFQGQEAEQSQTLFRHAKTLWQLMSQLVPVPTKLHRQARRQRVRRRLSEDVTVIHLRRYRPGGPHHEGESNIQYDHRWIVRGHWRKQPYGPRDNPSYRQIWINPYVKGPEDKEIKVTKRAFMFDR